MLDGDIQTINVSSFELYSLLSFSESDVICAYGNSKFTISYTVVTIQSGVPELKRNTNIIVSQRLSFLSFVYFIL
jgi:hypothetical protein